MIDMQASGLLPSKVDGWALRDNIWQSGTDSSTGRRWDSKHSRGMRLLSRWLLPTVILKLAHEDSQDLG